MYNYRKQVHVKIKQFLKKEKKLQFRTNTEMAEPKY